MSFLTACDASLKVVGAASQLANCGYSINAAVLGCEMIHDADTRRSLVHEDPGLSVDRLDSVFRYAQFEACTFAKLQSDSRSYLVEALWHLLA